MLVAHSRKQKIPKSASVFFVRKMINITGRGCRNRTHVCGFGGRRITTIRTPRENTGPGDPVLCLLIFLVQLDFFAEFAKLFYFQSLSCVLFILGGVVILIFADRAGQSNSVILRHWLFQLILSFFKRFWSRLSDSNRPPTVYKTVALPDELSRLVILFSALSF